MKIAIASGKGGTGKTTVATNLAYVASRNGRSVAYVDCDVEEPNGHIFLKPQFKSAASVGTLIPKVEDATCTYCGKCGEICQYSAIAPMEKAVLVFAELCHGCGGFGMGRQRQTGSHFLHVLVEGQSGGCTDTATSAGRRNAHRVVR